MKPTAIAPTKKVAQDMSQHLEHGLTMLAELRMCLPVRDFMKLALEDRFDINPADVQACLPGMVKKGWGRIVNFTGMNAMHGYAGRAPVSVAKHGVWGLTKALGKEFGPKGITVNAISPGPMKTLAGAAIGGARATFRHTEANAPMRANATLEAIGGTAVWLCSDYGNCTTGEVVHVDCGFHVLGMPQQDNL
jgi:enoyl-[acyl-carrier-protein] reductase (NADH)